MSCILDLAANDYVEFYASHDDGVNRTITPSNNQLGTWAMGQRLA